MLYFISVQTVTILWLNHSGMSSIPQVHSVVPWGGGSVGELYRFFFPHYIFWLSYDYSFQKAISITKCKLGGHVKMTSEVICSYSLISLSHPFQIVTLIPNSTIYVCSNMTLLRKTKISMEKKKHLRKFSHLRALYSGSQTLINSSLSHFFQWQEKKSDYILALHCTTPHRCSILAMQGQPESQVDWVGHGWRLTQEWLHRLSCQCPVTHSYQTSTWDWNPLTVVATAAASLCRRRAVLNWPFAGGPSWQWTREEKGVKTQDGDGEKGIWGMKHDQKKEKRCF